MATIPTKEIIFNGRKKIVNADDPRTGDAQQPAKPSKASGRKKGDD